MSRLNKYRRVHFLGFELFLSILFSLVFALWLFRFGGTAVVDNTLHDNRSAVYGTLAAIFGSLLGFVITALSIAIGYSTSEKFEFLKERKHYSKIWIVMISTVKALSIATIVMLSALVGDRDRSPNYVILCLCVFAIIYSSFRLYRCIWVLENVIQIIITDHTQ